LLQPVFSAKSTLPEREPVMTPIQQVISIFILSMNSALSTFSPIQIRFEKLPTPPEGYAVSLVEVVIHLNRTE